jgi:hypothetical protein
MEEESIMAVFRYVQCSFWNDPDLVDVFTPEDRYFYLYLMTNEHTSQCGIYQVSIKQIAFETGYSIETVRALMQRFEVVHGRIRYNQETRELAIRNWLKHNGPAKENDNILKRIIAELEGIQDRSLIGYIVEKAEAPLKALLSPFAKEKEKEKEKEQLATEPVPDSAAIDNRENLPTSPATKKAESRKAPEDPLYRPVWDSCLAMNGDSFSNYPREGEGCKRFCLQVRARSPDNPERTAQELLELFKQLREKGGAFWGGQPFTPSVLASAAIFDRLWTEYQRRAQKSDTSWIDKIEERTA